LPALDGGIVDDEVDVVPQERVTERVRVHEEGRYDDHGEMPARAPLGRARGSQGACVAPPPTPHARPPRSCRGLPVGAASAPPNPGHSRKCSAAARRVKAEGLAIRTDQASVSATRFAADAGGGWAGWAAARWR